MVLIELHLDTQINPILHLKFINFNAVQVFQLKAILVYPHFDDTLLTNKKDSIMMFFGQFRGHPNISEYKKTINIQRYYIKLKILCDIYTYILNIQHLGHISFSHYYYRVCQSNGYRYLYGHFCAALSNSAMYIYNVYIFEIFILLVYI